MVGKNTGGSENTGESYVDNKMQLATTAGNYRKMSNNGRFVVGSRKSGEAPILGAAG